MDVIVTAAAVDAFVADDTFVAVVLDTIITVTVAVFAFVLFSVQTSLLPLRLICSFIQT